MLTTGGPWQHSTPTWWWGSNSGQSGDMVCSARVHCKNHGQRSLCCDLQTRQGASTVCTTQAQHVGMQQRQTTVGLVRSTCKHKGKKKCVCLRAHRCHASNTHTPAVGALLWRKTRDPCSSKLHRFSQEQHAPHLHQMLSKGIKEAVPTCMHAARQEPLPFEQTPPPHSDCQHIQLSMKGVQHTTASQTATCHHSHACRRAKTVRPPSQTGQSLSSLHHPAR
jgi:hypothetical protein